MSDVVGAVKRPQARASAGSSAGGQGCLDTSGEGLDPQMSLTQG